MKENQNELDEHLSMTLFFYKIVFKVATSHIPFQLVYNCICYYLQNTYYHPN
jgi:hypothetical protein